MFDLVHAAGNTYYIENPARVGIYVIGKEAWLIDGGFAPDAGERILEIILKQGWVLKGIVATHAHPDHIGGCRYLQSKTECGIFAHGVEVALTQFPVLHPSFTYGGRPYRTLRGKSNMAEPSSVQEMEGAIPSELEIIPLRGHSFDMVGIRTPDDVVFLADALCAENVLERYGITFVYDVGAYLNTLDSLFEMKAALFVPAHVPPTADIRKLTQLNKKSVFSVADTIADWCVPLTTNEVLLKKVFKQYRRSINFDQYGLVGSTVRSYLAWLKDTGRVETEFRDDVLYWKKV
jgi:glyoxylase-like metal-dependent hydrolase (beta-lactamase superfamily II)